MDDGFRHLGGELAKVLKKLNLEVLDGLQHGFFNCSISSEIVNDRKRRVIITSAKSHRFIIPEEDLNK